MHPVFFKIGSLPIHSFGVMIGLAFLAGLFNWVLLGRKEGKDYAYCSDLLFWIMIAGIVGARVSSVISEFDYYRESPLRIFQIWRGGLIYYGGFAAAAVALAVFAWMRKERLLSVVDFVVTSIPLGHAFGRIGCFLHGCCHGIVQPGRFAVTYPGYPEQSLPWLDQWNQGYVSDYSRLSLPVVPVQLYEAAFNVALYLLILRAYRRREREGDVSALYLLTYPVARFALEFLRGDERMSGFGGLSVAQLMSIGLFAAGLALLLWPGRRRVEHAGSRPATAERPQPERKN